MRNPMHIAVLGGLLVISGCVQQKANHPVELISDTDFSPQVMCAVTNALEHSPRYLDLKHHASQPGVSFEELTNGWVEVEIGQTSNDGYFFHRWDFLKIQLNSGTILKLDDISFFRDMWFVEYRPRK